MSRRKRYSAEFKRETLKRANEEGVTDVLVAEELGINARQLRRWREAAKREGDKAIPGQGGQWYNGLGYLLTMIGDFSNAAWPPTTDPVTMTLDTWKLSAGNEDSTVRNMSCLGDGEFVDFPASGLEQFVTIVVKLEE